MPGWRKRWGRFRRERLWKRARAGLGIVSRLVRELHIPRLRDLLSREALDAQLDAMVREAVASGSPANNPRPASPEEIASLYGEAF